MNVKLNDIEELPIPKKRGVGIVLYSNQLDKTLPVHWSESWYEGNYCGGHWFTSYTDKCGRTGLNADNLVKTGDWRYWSEDPIYSANK